jgi:hypothetical protein
VERFKANSLELESEFKRAVAKFGYSEDTKLKFYSEVFQTLMVQFKKEVAKDENYDFIISTLYQFFIITLEEDEIDASKFKKDLEHFRKTELGKDTIFQVSNQSHSTPIYKQYNLNTKYGRRKAREQAYSNYANGSPEYKREIDNIRVVVWLVIIGIAIVVFLIKVLGAGKS